MSDADQFRVARSLVGSRGGDDAIGQGEDFREHVVVACLACGIAALLARGCEHPFILRDSASQVHGC